MNATSTITLPRLKPEDQSSLATARLSQTATTTGYQLLPSSALLAFAKRQVTQMEVYHGPEKRADLRHLLVMPVLVLPVDDKIRLAGPPQAMVIRDVSPPGLGLVHEFAFEHKRIVVQLSYPEDGKLLAAEVRWSKPLGPFYHIGCEVIAKLDKMPE